MSTVRDDRVFETVGANLAGRGGVTLQTIVEETGVSIGSLYHRYGSREGLLALTWLDAVRAFQKQFLRELESEGRGAGERAALATPRFCRAERGRAIVLSCCRASEFVSDETPLELQQEIRTVNDNTIAAVRRFARRSNYSLDACRMGLVAFPLGAVRLYLPLKPVPASVDAYVSAAFWSAVRA